MGILDRAFERRSTEQTFPLGWLRDPSWASVFSGGSITGAHITPENALRISGWFACLRIISSAVGKTPRITYRRLKKGKERAVNHPVYGICHDAPNPFMTPMEFFKLGQLCLLSYGNSFSFIERNGGGDVVALWPMHPSRIRLQIVYDENGGPRRIWYFHYPQNGGEQRLPMESVLHVRGLSCDGILGYSPVDLMREALGLAKIEEEYRARFFFNDARPGAIVEYPGTMSSEAFERYKRDWTETYAGLGNKFKIGFLEQGLKWHDVGLPPQTAQFIEGRQFQLEELARITGVPLVLLQSVEKTTSWGTGVAEIKRAFLENCLLDWFVEWEQRLSAALFTPTERKTYFVEHELKNYLRGDPKTEAEVLQIERRNGVINADDWLEITNRNPLPNKLGQIYIVEGNMTTLDKVGQGSQAPATPSLPASNGNGASPTRYLNGGAHE